MTDILAEDDAVGLGDIGLVSGGKTQPVEADDAEVKIFHAFFCATSTCDFLTGQSAAESRGISVCKGKARVVQHGSADPCTSVIAHQS